MPHSLRTIYTWVIVLFPILAIYETPISKVSIGDLALLILLPFLLLKYIVGVSDSLSRPQVSVLIFSIYILLSFAVQSISGYPAELISTLRFIFFLLVFVAGYDYFDTAKAIERLSIVSVIVSVWVICQFISFYFFTIILPWKLPILPVIDNSFVEIVNEPYFLQYYRPTGVFYEPTHFVQYTLVGLIANLTIKKRQINFSKYLIITATLMSASSLGLISLILVFLYKIFIIDGLKLNPIYVAVTVLLLLLLVPIISEIEYFSFIVTRVFDAESGGLGPAVGYRFNSLENLFNNNDDLKWLFGSGRGSEKEYFTGIFYLLNSIGIIGLLLYFYIIRIVFITSNQFGKMLVIIVFLLSFGSEVVANYGLLFYLPFCKFEKEKI